MTLEENSYAGGHLGRIQIPQEDLDNYGTIVGTSFGGNSNAPGSAHVLYETTLMTLGYTHHVWMQPELYV